MTDADLEFARREDVKIFLNEKLKEGDFKEFRKQINKFGKYRWSLSELEFFCEEAFELQSVMYLINHFNADKFCKKFFQNAIDKKAINTVKFLLTNKKSGLNFDEFVVMTNHLSYFDENLETNEDEISCIIVKRSILIRLGFELPDENTNILEYRI